MVKKEIEDGVVVKVYSVPVRSVVWCLSLSFSCKFLYLPMCILETEWNNPNTFRSHKNTPMTTTAFKIDLMEPAIGMKLLTSQRRTPTTFRAAKIYIGRRHRLITFLFSKADAYRSAPKELGM